MGGSEKEEELCTVQAKMCPEHKINSALYIVEFKIDEKKEKVLSAKCQGCPASRGTCFISLNVQRLGN